MCEGRHHQSESLMHCKVAFCRDPMEDAAQGEGHVHRVDPVVVLDHLFILVLALHYLDKLAVALVLCDTPGEVS
eukprot:Skav212840  [mRNA]  locus=scaffold2466:267939:271743:+ [translate_table: standard]